jgi:steroid delta-isomerase-like uncharacterized protein
VGQPTEVVTQYFEALSTGNVDGAVALIADDADFRSPIGPIAGRESIRGYLQALDKAFPEASYRIDTLIESTASVAAEGIYVATHTGPLPLPDGSEMAPTGREVSVPFVMMLRVVDGGIVSLRPYGNLGDFFAQLTN